jgi:Flp pilus assembly protein TadD
MREHLRLRPGDATGWAWLGNWLETVRRPDEAREAIDRALELEPEEPHILVHAARVSVLAGRLEEAIERLTRAVERGASTAKFHDDRDFVKLADDPRFQTLLARPDPPVTGRGKAR